MPRESRCPSRSRETAPLGNAERTGEGLDAASSFLYGRSYVDAEHEFDGHAHNEREPSDAQTDSSYSSEPARKTVFLDN